MYVYCVYANKSKAIAKLSENCRNNRRSNCFQLFRLWRPCLYMLPYFNVVLTESGHQKVWLGPWLNNTEVYLSPLLVLKSTQLRYKYNVVRTKRFCYNLQHVSSRWKVKNQRTQGGQRTSYIWVFFYRRLYNGESFPAWRQSNVLFFEDPASKGNVVGMIRQMTTAFWILSM